MKPNKIRTVMQEFKSGDLRSSSGKKVTNPKQAIAIALSEAGKSKPKLKEGGHMKESKEMMKKEVSFMKKKGAPKSMIKHEMEEAGVKKMRVGGRLLPKTPVHPRVASGMAAAPRSFTPYAARGLNTQRSRSRGIAEGGEIKASSGLAAGHKSADGIAKKGKTKGKEVVMKKGGMTKMKKGGYC